MDRTSRKQRTVTAAVLVLTGGIAMLLAARSAAGSRSSARTLEQGRAAPQHLEDHAGHDEAELHWGDKVLIAVVAVAMLASGATFVVGATALLLSPVTPALDGVRSADSLVPIVTACALAAWVGLTWLFVAQIKDMGLTSRR